MKEVKKVKDSTVYELFLTLKRYLKNKKLLILELILAFLSSGVLSKFISYIYQSAYCNYWNINISILRFDYEFGVFDVLIMSIGILFVFFSIAIVFKSIYKFVNNKKKCFWDFIISSALFVLGMFAISNIVISTDLLWNNYLLIILGNIISLYVITLLFSSVIIFLGTELYRKLDKIRRNGLFKKVLFGVTILGAVLGMFFCFGMLGNYSAEVKQEFYVYHETVTNEKDSGEVEEINLAYVLLYSDGEKGVFEQADYNGLNNYIYEEIPKIKINTKEQLILSFDNLKLEHKVFNRYPKDELDLRFER